LGQTESTYHFTFNLWEKIGQGTLKSIYLIYPNENHTISANDFHKLDFTYSAPNQGDTLMDSIKYGVIQKTVPFEKYETIINSHQNIQYQIINNASQKEIIEPIYLVQIDKHNNYSINVVAVSAKATASMTATSKVKGKTLASLEGDVTPHPVNFKLFYPEDILNEPDNSWITAKIYQNDISTINSLLQNYFPH
jgi:hypothetical protein